MSFVTEHDFLGLVGDIGGTNARFAIATRTQGVTKLDHFLSMPCAQYKDVYAALKAYFAQIGISPRLDYVCLAVAGPLENGEIKFTNLDWTVREDALVIATGARKARLVNDYEGLAFSLPHLSLADTHLIGNVQKGHGNVHAVLGAGTGFGASVLLGGEFGDYCLSTESGHASFAPVNDFENEIVTYLRKKHGRATIEMLLSGPGLVNLYQAICHIRGEAALTLTPAQITNLEEPNCQGCRYTVEAFLDILASVCGDLALYHGATAGIFIAGGIAPRLISQIDDMRFRARMEAKAPMTHRITTLPCHIITHPYAALLGAANTLSDHQIRS